MDNSSNNQNDAIAKGMDINDNLKPRTYSYGELMVGLHFNPGGSLPVNYAKEKFAEMIDKLYDLKNNSDDDMHRLICDYAIKDLVAAQMMVVKALTFK